MSSHALSTAEAFGDALLFDMDGILIDSEPLWRRAEIETFGEVGLELTDQDCIATMGLRIDEAVAYWFARKPWTDRSLESVAETIVQRVAELIRKEGCPLPGVHQAISEAQGRGLRLGLASSSSSLLIETVLEHFDLKGAFEVTRSAENEPHGKPHPAVYLATAKALGVAPLQCVAIEDSVNGVISALAAQMRCVAIPTADSRNDRRFEVASVRLTSLESLGEALDELWPGVR